MRRVTAMICSGIALVAAAPGTAVAAGRDSTLVVASVPDPSQAPGTGNVVQTFDAQSGAELGPTGGVPVGTYPYAIAITADGSTAYTANEASGTVTPVTVASASTAAALCLPFGNCQQPDTAAEPEAVAATPDGSAIFIANSGEDSISEISTSGTPAKVLDAPISSSSFSAPDALALTPDGSTLWVANYGSGTVVPVSLPSGRVGSPVSVGTSPTSLAVSPDGQTLLVANSASDSVSDVDLASSPVTVTPIAIDTTAPQPSAPQAVAISPDGRTGYVADAGNDLLVPIDLRTEVPGRAASICESGSFCGANPVSVAISPDGDVAFVADMGIDRVSALSLSGGATSLVRQIATNGSPDALALTPDQAPRAAFTVTPAGTNAPTSFDASASATNPAGGSLTYAWDFGDGATATTETPTTAHTYGAAGSYTATLTVTDADGTSTERAFTGQSISRNGGPSATASQSFTIKGPQTTTEAVVVGTNDTATLAALPSGPPPSAAPGTPTSVGSSPSAVAIDPTARTAYVVDGGSGQVSQVDIAGGQAEAASKWITVGAEPDAIAITPNGRYGYVVNGGSTTVSKVTLRTGSVSTIHVKAASGANLDAIAIRRDGRFAYVLDAGNNTITPIALQTGVAGGAVGGSGISDPDAIEVAPAGGYAYVVDGGSPTTAGGLTVVGLSHGRPQPIATVPIGSPGDHPDAIAVAPNGRTAYVVDAPTNGDAATITSVGLAGRSVVVGDSPAVPGATALYGIAVMPDGTAAYVTGIAHGEGVLVPVGLSGVGLTVEPPAALQSPPRGIAITPDQAPNAELTLRSPIPAGRPDRLSAAGSSGASSPIASYAFRFGDRSATVRVGAGTTSLRHVYAVAGVYRATVTATDRAGTSTWRLFAGQTVSLDGGPNAAATQTVHVYPTVKRVRRAGRHVAVITGAGFSTALGRTKVMFGGVRAKRVRCRSHSRCEMTVPAGTGTVRVGVLVNGQRSLVGNVKRFTYRAS